MVELVRDAHVPGLSDRRYAVVTPYGSVIEVSADDAPSGELGAIRWDDGVARPVAREAWQEQSAAPGSDACFGGTLSVADRFGADEWREAGTTPGGHRVLVPVEGGNDVSRAVRAWHEAASGTYDESYEWVTGAAAGYAYPTDDAFLAANALYAIQGPAGEWRLRLRADAREVVYECA